MEQLIFFAILIVLSIVDSLARRKKRLEQGGASAPSPPVERDSEPWTEKVPWEDDVPTYDEDPSYDDHITEHASARESTGSTSRAAGPARTGPPPERRSYLRPRSCWPSWRGWGRADCPRSKHVRARCRSSRPPSRAESMPPSGRRGVRDRSLRAASTSYIGHMPGTERIRRSGPRPSRTAWTHWPRRSARMPPPFARSSGAVIRRRSVRRSFCGKSSRLRWRFGVAPKGEESALRATSPREPSSSAPSVGCRRSCSTPHPRRSRDGPWSRRSSPSHPRRQLVRSAGSRAPVRRRSPRCRTFPAAEAERFRGLAVHELQRQHPHADQVAAVDALEALGDHRADAQQDRPLRGPIAGAPVPYSLPARTTSGVPASW